jgi:hypothetical protein
VVSEKQSGPSAISTYSRISDFLDDFFDLAINNTQKTLHFESGWLATTLLESFA